MAFPVIWYFWWAVMIFEPRAPEDRHVGNMIGRPTYQFRAH